MKNRAAMVLLGVMAVVLTLNLAALRAKDDPKPMITVQKRCVGITSQMLPGQGLCLIRAFEDGTTEFLLARDASTLGADRWRAVGEAVGAGTRG